MLYFEVLPTDFTDSGTAQHAPLPHLNIRNHHSTAQPQRHPSPPTAPHHQRRTQYDPTRATSCISLPDIGNGLSTSRSRTLRNCSLTLHRLPDFAGTRPTTIDIPYQSSTNFFFDQPDIQTKLTNLPRSTTKRIIAHAMPWGGGRLGIPAHLRLLPLPALLTLGT